MKRFVDIKNDVAFRKIFGNEEKTNILISFLNAALKLEEEQSIVEVVLVDPFQLPRIAGEKASVIDVRAKDIQGRQFVIEMQVADVDGFGKRVQYYACRDYSMQIGVGDKYSKLKPTFFIGILDFNYFDSEDYISHHDILNRDTYEHKLKDIQFTFIELQKFTKKPHELETLIEKWVYFIKNATELDDIPKNVADDGLLQAYRDAEKHRWGAEEWRAYDNAAIAEQDKIGRVTIAVKKAEQRGEKKAVKEMVLRCLDKGMAIAVIADITGLMENEVRAIINEAKI